MQARRPSCSATLRYHVIMNNAQLLDALLALPPDERVNLALRALESVPDADDDEVCATEAAWEEAWATEIEERIARDEPSVLLDDVIAEMRRRRG